MKLRHLFSAALLFASFSANAELIHQYRLNNSLVDDFGGPSLVANGGSFTADRYVFGANQGLTLNENLGSVYTIDFVYNFSNQTSYRKLIDYRNRTTDNGVYTHTGRALFYVSGTYGGTGTQMLPNVDSQVTVTRDASGAMQAFVNKELMFSFMDSGSALTFGNIASFFMDDGAVAGEASPGQVDYIRTPRAIALEPALDALGKWAQCNIKARDALMNTDVSTLMWQMRGLVFVIVILARAPRDTLVVMRFSKKSRSLET